jgi:hypothetical protein
MAARLRRWQEEALAAYLRSTPRDFLAVATPGAAWLNFTGTSPPSGNPSTVSVIAG